MKAIRTIVATAVIVFALTSVAMAGVQRLGDGADPEAGTQATAAAAPAAAHAGEVTLSERQFAALLHAVAAQDRTRAAHHDARCRQDPRAGQGAVARGHP